MLEEYYKWITTEDLFQENDDQLRLLVKLKVHYNFAQVQYIWRQKKTKYTYLEIPNKIKPDQLSNFPDTENNLASIFPKKDIDDHIRQYQSCFVTHITGPWQLQDGGHRLTIDKVG